MDDFFSVDLVPQYLTFNICPTGLQCEMNL